MNEQNQKGMPTDMHWLAEAVAISQAAAERNGIKEESAVASGTDLFSAPYGEPRAYTHALKINPASFHAVAVGNKRAEYRINDRNFKVSDRLLLCEYTDDGYTGQAILVNVTHVQTEYLPEGYCNLSFDHQSQRSE